MLGCVWDPGAGGGKGKEQMVRADVHLMHYIDLKTRRAGGKRGST